MEQGILWLEIDKDVLTQTFEPMYRYVPDTLHMTLAFGCDRKDYHEMLGKEFPLLVGPNCWNSKVQAVPVNYRSQFLDQCLAGTRRIPHVTLSLTPNTMAVEANDMLASGDHYVEGQSMLMENHRVGNLRLYASVIGTLRFKPFVKGAEGKNFPIVDRLTVVRR